MSKQLPFVSRTAMTAGMALVLALTAVSPVGAQPRDDGRNRSDWRDGGRDNNPVEGRNLDAPRHQGSYRPSGDRKPGAHFEGDRRPDYRPDYRPDSRPGYRPDYRPDHRPDHRVERRPDYRPGPPPGYARGAGPDHGWYRGGYVPPAYRTPHYVVNDWRYHRLSAPPRGYHWVQYGGDYLLVAIATGVIVQLMLGN